MDDFPSYKPPLIGDFHFCLVCVCQRVPESFPSTWCRWKTNWLPGSRVPSESSWKHRHRPFAMSTTLRLGFSWFIHYIYTHTHNMYVYIYRQVLVLRICRNSRPRPNWEMRVHRISFILRGPSSNNSAPPKTIRSHHGFFHCYREISSISSVSFYNLGKSRRHSRRIPPWELELLAYIHRI